MSRDPVPEWFGKGDADGEPVRRGDTVSRSGGGCFAPFAILMLALAVGGGVFAFLFTGQKKNDDRTTAVTKRPEPLPPPAVPEATVVPVPAVEPPPVPEPPTAADETEEGEEGAEEPAGTTLSAAEIKKVMDSSRGRFRACYENALSYQPNAEGKVVSTLTIGQNGRVKSVSTTQSGNIPNQVGVCIAAITRTLKFPESSQDTTVSYPMTFRSE